MTEPRRKESKQYKVLYEKIYANLSASVRPVVHAIDSLRGGGSNQGECTEVKLMSVLLGFFILSFPFMIIW